MVADEVGYVMAATAKVYTHSWHSTTTHDHIVRTLSATVVVDVPSTKWVCAVWTDSWHSAARGLSSLSCQWASREELPHVAQAHLHVCVVCRRFSIGSAQVVPAYDIWIVLEDVIYLYPLSCALHCWIPLELDVKLR